MNRGWAAGSSQRGSGQCTLTAEQTQHRGSPAWLSCSKPSVLWMRSTCSLQSQFPDSGTFPTEAVWGEGPQPGVRAGS